MVEDAKSRVKEADFREIKRRLDAREKLTLIDVREDNEWARGHLPGAVHLGKGIIERDIEQAFPIRKRRWCSTAEADSGPPWPPIICRRWATPTSFPWMAAGVAGPTAGYPVELPGETGAE